MAQVHEETTSLFSISISAFLNEVFWKGKLAVRVDDRLAYSKVEMALPAFVDTLATLLVQVKE